MDKNTWAILAGALMIVTAILYSNGVFDSNEAQIEYGFEAVLHRKFSDPESVRIRNVFRDSQNHKSFCGEVNARNKLGGYVGYQRFIALDMTSLEKPWNVVIASEVADNFPIWCSK